MKTITLFILFGLIACGSIANFKSDNENFIQGKWRLAGTLGDKSENRAWFLEWEFKDGKFTQNGYPPILQKGSYKLIEDNENNLKLKMYNQEGTFGTDESELIIVIDKENNTLTISNKKGFKRVKD